MSPQLLEYVERELFEDLRHYGVTTGGTHIDWSDPVQEGHRTHYLGGMFEEMSDVAVVDERGGLRAEGWVDFVHGAQDAPLFVFWLYLAKFDEDGVRVALKTEPRLPEHVWQRLPESSKALCATQGRYDRRWAQDPLVSSWRASRA